jgi:cytochrome P450 family 135
VPRLPPGPSTGPIAQTVRLHRDPLGVLRGLQAQFGDVFTIRLATARPLVVVADPDAVAALADSDPVAAHAGEARRRILPMASTRGAFGGDGEQHRAARRRIADGLRPDALLLGSESMARFAEKHADAWPRRGEAFRLLDRMRQLVDDVFVRLVLGVRDEQRARAAISALRRALRTPGNPPFTLPGDGDGLAGVAGNAVFRRRTGPLLAVLRGEIEARRRAGDLGDDLIGVVLRDEPDVSAAAIADELLVLLMAAQEPPSIALTRLVARLNRVPAEPDADVVRETLRLWPPAFAILRRLTVAREVGGHALPAGATVVVPLPVVQRDARAASDPDVFWTGRWQRDEPTAFAPFGGGARRCVGEPLAQAYFGTILPALLRRIRLAPVAPDPEPMVLRGTVLVPRDGLLVRRIS